MSVLEINTEDLFTLTEVVEVGHIQSRIVGRAETASRPNLDGYIKRLHDTAMASKASIVTVDMRRLDFMNSSCFKSFVVWLGNISEADSQYRVRFLSDDAKHWQSRSLCALACFAMDLVDIQPG